MLYIEKVTVGDSEYLNVPADSLLEIGVPEEQAQTMIAEATAQQKQRDQVEHIRSAIQSNAGDTLSLLGTTSDATQLLLYGFTTLIAKLHTANSLAEVREAAAPFAELSAGFLAKVEGGEVKLPFMVKGLDSVVSDIEQRATTVAEVLQSTTNGE